MKVCVTGHRGYVGQKLFEKLGNPIGIDWMDYQNPMDIRNRENIQKSFDGCDVVIHLANISNDPSFDLSPNLAKSVNWDCFPMMVHEAARAGVKRFIFASSSSVYGVKDTENVTEDMQLEPLTDYSKYKALCEEYLHQACPESMEFVILRPATICGYSPSMRLDLLVNIFTHHAWVNGVINVHGGHQYRPNIHIDDMVDAYIKFLNAPDVNRETFNVGYKNLTILETAEMVRDVIGKHITINVTESTDPRSYHVNSDKVKHIFTPNRSIESAIDEMLMAFIKGLIPNPDANKYYRVRQIKSMGKNCE